MYILPFSDKLLQLQDDFKYEPEIDEEVEAVVSDYFGLRSQDGFLERNFQSKQAEVFDLIAGELEESV